VGAGLVCGLLVPADAAVPTRTSSVAHRTTAFASPAVLLGSTPSPFAAASTDRRTTMTSSTGAGPAVPAPVSAVRAAATSEPATAVKHAVVATKHPLPARSGSGRRIVYSERAAHLWVVGDDGTVLRDYAVTGRVGRPKPGVYHVYSKSTIALNPGEKLRFEYMVRFAVGITGARIGFHTIPRYFDGVPIQKESQLGRAIGAGGCVRQSRADAQWLYAWSRIGDTVVVRL
jgi:hypothetical protein